jgi:hypothetical protein
VIYHVVSLTFLKKLDLRTLFLKSRIADGPEHSAAQTVQASTAGVSVQPQQSYPPQNTPLYPELEGTEEDDQLNVFHQNLVESFLGKGASGRFPCSLFMLGF